MPSRAGIALAAGLFPRLARMGFDAPTALPPAARLAFALLCLPRAAVWTRRACRFERDLDRGASLGRAAARLIAPLVRRLHHRALGPVPAEGPLLLVANHAGLGDALGVLATVARRDVLILVRDDAFLRALPALGRRLVTMPKGEASAAPALAALVRHLRRGGAVLMFPAGRIEPDPGLDLDGARAALAGWSARPTVLARRVPGLVVVAAAVGRLSPPRAVRLARRLAADDEAERSYLRGVAQMFLPGVARAEPVVALRPLRPGEGRDGAALRQAMAALLAEAAEPDAVGMASPTLSGRPLRP
ncbi:MAG: 1-acyl-sn-glycerol-3-phosphate acyltransferase [Paracoccaceae bacterium]